MTPRHLSDPFMRIVVIASLAVLAVAAWGTTRADARGVGGCAHFGAPAIAADPHARALRVFAVQFRQEPAEMASASDYEHAIDCAIASEVLPHLARGRPNLVVFDEDVGLEALAIGSRGAGARALLQSGAPSCAGLPSPCETLATLTALDTGYGPALSYLQSRFPSLSTQLGKSFIAATDVFVRVFMTTMAQAARRYDVYIVASNTQAPFALTRDGAAVAALRDPATPDLHSVYEPTSPLAYDQTFLWGPRVVHPRALVPLQNLLVVNRKVPLTGFEQLLGFANGPATGSAAIANLRPFPIPGTGARLGFATSLPAFTYGPVGRVDACADVAVTYMRCLDRLGANVVIQADANDGEWTGAAGSEPWQPLDWMGSAYRAVSDPTVHFEYAVNPFMVGNLADTPFDGQSAILQRGRRGAGCNYVGDGTFVAGQDEANLRQYAGPKPEFLALAPWVASGGSRATLGEIGSRLALPSSQGGDGYVQSALIADLPFPPDSHRAGCIIAGR